jgi:hypothetical protein
LFCDFDTTTHYNLLIKNSLYHTDVPGKGKDLGECNGKSYFYVDSKVKSRGKKTKNVLIFAKYLGQPRLSNGKMLRFGNAIRVYCY